MVTPPKYAKAVHVTNSTDEKLSVTCTYDGHHDGELTETAEVAPGSTFEFPEKTVQAKEGGTFAMVAPVKSVKAGSTTFIPSTNGVVSAVKVLATSAGKGLHLAQQ